jgi:hypothetical protein
VPPTQRAAVTCNVLKCMTMAVILSGERDGENRPREPSAEKR